MEILGLAALLTLALISMFLLGVTMTIQVGKHFTDSYVEKMTPEKLKAIEEMDNTIPHVTPEEVMWARGMSPQEIEQYYINNPTDEGGNR